MLEAFQDMWKEQESVVQRTREKVRWVEGEVGSLEERSWRREGAEEDLGSAGPAGT